MRSCGEGSERICSVNLEHFLKIFLVSFKRDFASISLIIV